MEAEAILAKEDALIACSPPYSQELPEENFLEIVPPAALGLRKCHGCKGEIIRIKCPPPKRFGLCMQALQIWKD